MDLMRAYPSVDDLRAKAKRRIPKFAFDYLDGGAGDESGMTRNRDALHEIKLMPNYLETRGEPDLSVEIFGHTYDLPFGIAPIGLGGLIWPLAAEYLAQEAVKTGAAFCLSTVASSSVETIGPMAGEMSWFQLYPIRRPEQEEDLLKRAWDAGFKVLAVTVDIPGPGRRIRDFKNGLTIPPSMTLRNILSMASCPAWGLSMLASGGAPRFQNLEKYFPKDATFNSVGAMIQDIGQGVIDYKRLEKYRAQWKGPIVLKGVLSTSDAKRCLDTGMNGLMVSNHGGRQLDALPSPIDVMPALRDAVGPDFALIVDSGLRTGTDIIKAYAAGADFVFLGRAFMYAVAALGQKGCTHVTDLLKTEIISAMVQLGLGRPKDAPSAISK